MLQICVPKSHKGYHGGSSRQVICVRVRGFYQVSSYIRLCGASIKLPAGHVILVTRLPRLRAFPQLNSFKEFPQFSWRQGEKMIHSPKAPARPRWTFCFPSDCKHWCLFLLSSCFHLLVIAFCYCFFVVVIVVVVAVVVMFVCCSESAGGFSLRT